MRIRLKFRLDDQTVYGCFSSVHRIGSAPSSAVLYTPQELTDEEKAQARKNIGALSLTAQDQVAALIETDMLPAVHDADGKILTDENGKIILRY